MPRDSALNVSVGVIAAVVVCVAAYQANEVFAPLALALFIIALVWPLQSWLMARMPALLALAITMTLTVAVCIAFASLVAWGFGRVGVSLVADSARYQALYEKAIDWLEERGISVAGLWSEHFNVGWLVHWAGQITGRVNSRERKRSMKICCLKPCLISPRSCRKSEDQRLCCRDHDLPNCERHSFSFFS